ncbi:tyrosine-type recombinase/integrase [Dysgonomonas hofstadii]|uniref:tyrosine-type recombinase/integrase n=1 Tax=Dysgonomonas hofstadii TaxID=637886 RepID=UPI001FE83E31|nr:tyrosine-type recombinase/integrase [Dysgonomonas hofstadii]
MCFFHCARHTAATLNLSLGIPIETVSKLLGHTKISTTQIYARIIDQAKKDAVSKQNGIFD